jgi:hypothetical protein
MAGRGLFVLALGANAAFLVILHSNTRPRTESGFQAAIEDVYCMEYGPWKTGGHREDRQ